MPATLSRLLLVLVAAALLSGCGGAPGDQLLAQPANPEIPRERLPEPRPRADGEELKTPLLRALQGALQRIEDLDDDQRKVVEDVWYEHDATLHKELGESSLQKILRANRKPTSFAVRHHSRQRVISRRIGVNTRHAAHP